MTKPTLWLLLALSSGLLAQTADPLLPPPTKLEVFLLQKNHLILQESTRIGQLDRKGEEIRVEGIVARYAVRRVDGAKGLRVTVPSGAKFSVDGEELELMLKAMQNMENQYQNWQENNPVFQQDLFFATKSGFEVSLHYLEGTVTAEAGGPITAGFSSIELDLGSLRELRRLLEQAYAWLLSR
jgi:hypothetical protein